jgi:hypothetical protein
MLEIQALVSTAVYGTPQYNRIQCQTIKYDFGGFERAGFRLGAKTYS